MERTGESVSAEQVNADFMAYDIATSVERGFADEKAVKLKTSHKRLSRTRGASEKKKSTSVA